MREPSDVLAEGLVSEDRRGDKTPLELFIARMAGFNVEFHGWLKAFLLARRGAWPDQTIVEISMTPFGSLAPG
jgi:hypothetical protein